MNKTHSHSGLLFTPLPFPADFASLLPTPSAHHEKNNQAVLTALPTTPQKKNNLLIRLSKECKGKLIALMGLLWLWLLARFYTNEKRRQIPRWSCNDLALLKFGKDNTVRLWNIHRSDRST